MNKKVFIPLFIIIVSIFWLATSNLGKANYYLTVDQLADMGEEKFTSMLKIRGRVVPGSIVAEGAQVRFTLHEQGKDLNVRYVGDDPLPDLFKDHAETVVNGTLTKDGTFQADHLQAKCSSKYEAADLTKEEPPPLPTQNTKK